MKHILQPGDGEVLKLGPPAAGEVIIKVDPRQSGAPLTMGTETLLARAEIPVHRHLHQDEVVFVHKGQGRATLEGESMTVVPGTVIYAPRAAWHGLRNTGTGVLQITWMASPAGIEEFFRDLSKLGSSADASAILEIGRRHGVEFRSEGGAPTQELGHRRRRHRGGRGRGRGGGPTTQRPQPPQSTSTHPAPVSQPQPATAAGPRPPGRGPRRRHRRREAGSTQVGSQSTVVTSQTSTGAVSKPTAPTPSSAAARSRGRSDRRRRFGRVKEVYMGGRWVRVVGEGPVISTGEARPEKPEGNEP